MTESEKELRTYADSLIRQYAASLNESERDWNEQLNSLLESQKSLEQGIVELEQLLEHERQTSQDLREQLIQVTADRDRILLDFQTLSENLSEIMHIIRDKLPDLYLDVMSRLE